MSETRDELIGATGEVLAREGYGGLTTEKVAAEAGVSHPAVHYHFDTKAGLLVAFVEATTEDWLDVLHGVEGDDAGQRLAGVLSLFVDSLHDSGQADLVRALLELHTRAPHVDGLQDALAEHDRRTTAFVASIIENGVEAGVFRDVDPETTAELLLCTADGATVRQYTLDGDAAAVLTEGLTRHVLADLYVGDVPDLGGAA